MRTQDCRVPALLCIFPGKGSFCSRRTTESLLSRYLLDLYCWSKLIHNLCMRLWINSLPARGQPAFKGLLNRFCDARSLHRHLARSTQLEHNSRHDGSPENYVGHTVRSGLRHVEPVRRGLQEQFSEVPTGGRLIAKAPVEVRLDRVMVRFQPQADVTVDLSRICRLSLRQRVWIVQFE